PIDSRSVFRFRIHYRCARATTLSCTGTHFGNTARRHCDTSETQIIDSLSPAFLWLVRGEGPQRSSLALQRASRISARSRGLLNETCSISVRRSPIFLI